MEVDVNSHQQQNEASKRKLVTPTPQVINYLPDICYHLNNKSLSKDQTSVIKKNDHTPSQSIRRETSQVDLTNIAVVERIFQVKIIDSESQGSEGSAIKLTSSDFKSKRFLNLI